MRRLLNPRARRGQSAVLIALVLFAMLLLVAMSTNIGIVVNDRIRMQTTADAATYAAAYHEAASLNELTELNQDIADAVRDCRRTLESQLWPETVPCGCQPNSISAEIAVFDCKRNIDTAIMNFINRARYDQTVSPALAAGRATAGENFTGVEMEFFTGIFGAPTAMGTHNLMGGLNLGAYFVLPSIADFRQVSDTMINYRVLATCPSGNVCVPNPMTKPPETIRTWFYKETRDPDIWVAGRASGTPEKQFLDTAYGNGSDGGYFGASSTGGDDKLYAYAVAKPYDGSVGPSGLNGNQQNGNMNVAGVYVSRGVTYPKLSMYDEYRARLAGINEDLKGPLSPTQVIQMDGLTEGKTWDMGSFKH